MVEIAMFNVRRTVTPEVSKPKLRSMCSACRLIVLYISLMFRESIPDGIRVMERTRIMEAMTDGCT